MVPCKNSYSVLFFYLLLRSFLVVIKWPRKKEVLGMYLQQIIPTILQIQEEDRELLASGIKL